MDTHDEPLATVQIGGREVSLLVAALTAQEADRLGILPGKVGDVVLPVTEPTYVVVAGLHLTIDAAAMLAAEADERQLLMGDVVAVVLKEHAEHLAGKETRGEDA